MDLKLNAPPDVSREHCRIRRDPATGRFFLKDVSQFGTTIDGRRIPGSVETSQGQDRDKNIEAPIPPRAVIGLADSVFLNFEAEMRVQEHDTLWWLRYPFLTIFLALIVWFVYVLFARTGKDKWL